MGKGEQESEVNSSEERLLAEIESLKKEIESLQTLSKSSWHNKFERLFESNFFMLFIVDGEGKTLAVNDFGAHELGYTKEELIGASVFDVFVPEDRSIVKHHLTKCIRNPRERFTWELHKLTKSEEIISVAESAVCLSDENNSYEVLILCENITEERRIDDERRRYEFIVNTSKNFLTLINTDYEYEAVNDAYCRAHKLKREEIIGRTVVDIWGEKVFDATIKKHLDNCFKGKDVNYGAWFVTKANGKRFFDVRYHPYIDEKTGGTCAVVYTIDATERKLQEEAVIRRDKILKVISSAAALFLTSPDWRRDVESVLAKLGKAAEVSRAYIFQNGISKSGVLTTSQIYVWVNRLEGREGVNPELQNVPYHEAGLSGIHDKLAKGEIFSGIVRDFRPEEKSFLEKYKIKSLAIAPIFSGNKWWGLIGFDDCETARKWTNSELDVIKTSAGIIGAAIGKNQSDLALKTGSERYELAIDASQVDVWDIDIETGDIYAYGNLKSRLGYGPNELQNYLKFWLKTVHPDDRGFLDDLYSDYITGKVSKFESETRMVAKSGIVLWILIRGRVIKDKNGKPVRLMGTATDITERKTIERELIAAKNKAEKADRLKSEFLAQMSHEVRTPLNVILNFSEMIEEELGALEDSDMKDNFEVIKNESRRIIRTMDMILMMSEVQSGTVERRPEKFDLEHDVLDGIVHEYKPAADEKNVFFNFFNHCKSSEIDSDLPTIRESIRQIIDNAVKFTPSGEIEIYLDDYDGKIQLVIEDPGVGISAQYLAQLFDPFSQEEQGYSRKYEGNGLGLALVQKYCELNNVEIDVKSDKGKGTIFKLTFP